MAISYEPGIRCWIRDEKEGWVGAEVVNQKTDGEKVTINLTLENGEEKSVETSVAALKSASELPQLPLRNPPILESTEDLTSLSYLNEPSVLHAIRTRYQMLNIYTYSGIVLIATNPFQRVDNLYTPDIIQAYAGKTRGELEPHLFAIAEDAYRCMLRDKKDQTIVVSGESGAGKTVSAKYIMRYFATVEDPLAPRKRDVSQGDSLSHVEEQILATNPIMEAFGNAKTTRNDNSSRFGKYLEINFNKDVDIVGARIRTFLLERSRLVFQPATERNYHIFYQLVKGASPELAKALGVNGGVPAFRYLNQGGNDIIEGVDDREEFKLTGASLETIGIGKPEQESLWNILAGILHIGNIEIGQTRQDAVLSSDEPSLVKACELLQIDPVQFAKWITKKQIVTRADKIVSNQTHKQSLVVRDSVSKHIYTSLFDWLVSELNGGLCDPKVQEQVETFIGVLDIFGFEHFKKNSFEQFCINYANEKLQQEFNQHVFKLEQDEYVQEEINWTFIDFSDNQPCIDLIEAKLGILSLLDEESRLPAGSDEGWCTKLYQQLDNPQNKHFKKPRFGNTSFVVAHYAQDVNYEAEGFVEKNRDAVPDEHLEVLMATKNEFLKNILDVAANVAAENAPAAPTKPGLRAPKKPTLGRIFKGSLIDLMTTINSTNVHYIRCIKPNEEKAAWSFSAPIVLSQLRACGVLETIRISCAGFPSRWSYEEFISRYYMLVPSSEWASMEVRDLCNLILEKTIKEEDKFQLGKTKIFFRAGMLAYLERLRSDRLNECAIVIQKNVRKRFYRKKYLDARQSIIAAQTLFRAHIARARFQELRKEQAAVKIQSAWRGYSGRRDFMQQRDGIVRLQAIFRGTLVRRNIQEVAHKSAALTIQRNYRGYVARKEYRGKLKSIVLIQSLIRRRQAKAQLKQLKVEAKSEKHFKEVQYRLENKVVELTQSLTAKRDENKKLLAEMDLLNARSAAATAKSTENSSRVEELENAVEEKERVHQEEVQEMELKLAALDKQYQTSVAQLTELEDANAALKQELEAKTKEVADKVEATNVHIDTNKSLTEQLEQAKHEIEKLKQNGVVASDLASVSPVRGTPGTAMNAKRRNIKRRSLTSAGMVDGATAFTPRASAAGAAAGAAMGAAAGANAEQMMASLGVNGQIEQLLESQSDELYDEVIEGLIHKLNIPIPHTSDDQFLPREVLFPAHILNLITSEMWRLGFIKESERFLARVMEAIQKHILELSGEAVIYPGAFWLSNVHEIMSFVCLAQANIAQNVDIMDEMGEYEFQQYGRLVHVVKADLENLEFNIYHTWMKELKKLLDKMIVPAIVLSQALPGFMTTDSNGRFLAKMFTSNVSYSMDDLLNLFNKVYKAMTCYFNEKQSVRQSLMELLSMIGVKAFNDLLMRKNFLSWKRGLQINYNITRIEEWCKSHDIADGVVKLEHLMQSAKLLQLKKSTLEDIEIIYDICWILTPSQIHRLIGQYLSADYEAPISSEIMNTISEKVKLEKNAVLLLETSPLEDSGPFEICEPRLLKRLDSYIPAVLQVPLIRRFVELTTLASGQNNEDQHGRIDGDISEEAAADSVSADHVVPEESTNGHQEVASQ
ncbi:Myosin-2 [Yarrowia sp. C11]|nr:Myosin-2 [Yarrowia sp. E02]KAG5372354.1 Myosin-2 [Yarrowia sp. C11]